MKLTQADTQIGVKFSIVEFEEGDIVALIQDPTKLSRITDAVNADRRQKVALVEARYDLSNKIGSGDETATPPIIGLGFARKTTQIKKGEEMVTVPDETENAHIKRFVDALVTGTFTTPGWTLPSGDDKVKETAAEAFLQSLASQCGDKVQDGKPCYILNLDKAARTGAGNLIPNWAKLGASQIVNNGSQAAWAEKFTNGYVSKSGVTITPFPFEDFNVVAPADATPDAKQAVLDTNLKRLAKCLVEQRRQENAASQSEFV